MSELTFLKLGGSLITDKTGFEKLRPEVLQRLSAEIRRALDKNRGLQLVVGHGSGSFGHVAAARFGTRQGARSEEEWLGFAEVSSAAARLNSLVREAMLEAGVPAVTFQPSASAICRDGQIRSLAVDQIKVAVNKGLVPLVYGDVAIDDVRGATIISTEEILSYTAHELKPQRFLLAGEVDGVVGPDNQVLQQIRTSDEDQLKRMLGGSRGTDVTGGMAAKVQDMLQLVSTLPGIRIRIFSGLVEGSVERCLTDKKVTLGTEITAG
jgi:isopentenyl phosphate kinase